MKIRLCELRQIIQEEMSHVEVMTQLKSEYPDWNPGDLEDAALTTTVTMSPENEDVQLRYQELRGSDESKLEAYKHVIIGDTTIPLYTSGDVLDHLFPNNWYRMSLDKQETALTTYAEQYNLIEYERPRKEFDPYEAAQHAYDAGASGAIVNDLS